MWKVYIIKCKNNALYTGITADLKRRLNEHTSSKVRKYTTYNRLHELVYSEEYENRFEAENRENQIKKWSKSKKLALINADFSRLRELSKSRD